MIRLVLMMYHIPEDIQAMQDDYFNVFWMKFSAVNFTTDWINLKIGIAKISPQAVRNDE